MRMCLILLFVLASHEVAYSSSHAYSLPSHCSVLFVSEGLTDDFSRMDIIAAEDGQGKVSSPFEITGYDETGRLMRSYVIGEEFASTNLVVAAPALGQDVISREIIRNGFCIGDRHFKISANQVNGVFRVVVENLDTRHLDTKVAADAARLFAKDTPTGWPLMDEGRRYRCSSEDVSVLRARQNGLSKVLGILRLRGALYQEGCVFSVHFSLYREVVNGVLDAIAKGVVVGAVSEGEIQNRVVSFSAGQKLVELKVNMVENTGTILPRYKKMNKDRERIWMQGHAIRLELSYGAAGMKIDLPLQEDQDVPERR